MGSLWVDAFTHSGISATSAKASLTLAFTVPSLLRNKADFYKTIEVLMNFKVHNPILFNLKTVRDVLRGCFKIFVDSLLVEDMKCILLRTFVLSEGLLTPAGTARAEDHCISVPGDTEAEAVPAESNRSVAIKHV